MSKNKKIVESIIVFLFFSVIVILFNLNSKAFNYDKIWVFHMMQKIANGDLIYTEMNVITGPLFYLVGGAVFKIFGASFVVYDIFSGISYGVFAILFYNIAKEIGDDRNKFLDVLILFFLLANATIIGVANYNIFCLSFIMLAMLMEIKKNKEKSSYKYDFLNGIFLACAFLSKQTVGGMAVIASGLISLIYGIAIEKRNPIKEILMKMAGFFCIMVPAIIVMLCAGNFYDYINLCFGSILEFGGNNTNIRAGNPYFVIMLAIFITGLMVWNLNKSDKELFIINLYAIANMFFALPLANTYHIYLALFTSGFILIKTMNILQEYEKKDIIKLIVVLVIVALRVSPYFDVTSSDMEENEITLIDIIYNLFNIILLCTIGYGVIEEKYKFIKINFYALSLLLCIGLLWNYGYGVKNEVVPQGLEIYSKHAFDNSELERISAVIEYIKEKENEGYKVMVVSSDASLYMAPMNRNNNEFDLFFYGNLGYKGVQKTVDKMKTWKNTIILRNEERFWQEPKEIDEYLEKNCEEIGEIEDMEIYYQR